MGDAFCAETLRVMLSISLRLTLGEKHPATAKTTLANLPKFANTGTSKVSRFGINLYESSVFLKSSPLLPANAPRVDRLRGQFHVVRAIWS